MKLPGFIAGEYSAASPLISSSQAINIYPEFGQFATNQFSFVGVPGTVLAYDFQAPIRAIAEAWDTMYVVAGNKGYLVARDHTVTELGAVNNDGKPACIANNIAEVLFVSGLKGYVSQKSSSTLTEIADADFPETEVCDFLDGYGLVVEKGTGRFRFTEIDDFESISGIDFATAESSPDTLISLIVDHRELWLFGTDTIEIWFNSGDATSPFQRLNVVERGCYGPHVPAKLDNTVFWLGEDGVAYRADGITPIRISNHGIEHLITQTTTDPVGFAYNDQGHAFYQLTFPDELTVVYDASTQLWHRRKTKGREDCTYQHHAQAYGRNYVGGSNGKLYYLDRDTYTHEGELERIRTIGPLRVTKFSSMSSLTALFETGVNADYINESKVFLQISDDAGRTYSGPIEASIGHRGEYTTEVKFLGLGGFYDGQRVLKLTMTDDARYSLVDVDVNVA